ncbi:uncharacterized [Tachysurus ichikawai]
MIESKEKLPSLMDYSPELSAFKLYLAYGEERNKNGDVDRQIAGEGLDELSGARGRVVRSAAVPGSAASLVVLKLLSEMQIKKVTGVDLDGVVRHHSCFDK